MKPPRILIVEDDPDAARLLENWLRAGHYQFVGAATDGQQALALADSTRPDLVILDIVLPGELDGIEVARRLQAHHDIPVLYLTAFTDEALFERARTTSPAAYLTKPFEARELGRAVEVALDRHALLRRAKESEAHLAEAQTVARLGSWCWDLLHDRITASNELLRLFDLDAEAFEPRIDTFLQRMHAEDQPRALAAIEALLQGGDPGSLDVRLIRSADAPRVLRLQGSARFDAAGKPLELLGTARDVTEEWQARQDAERYRSRIEALLLERTAVLGATRTRLDAEIAEHQLTGQHLEKAEALYRELVESLPDALIVIQDGLLAFVNPAAARLAGVLAPGELLGKPVTEFIHPDFHPLLERRIAATLSGDERNPTIAYAMVDRNGRSIDVETTSFSFEFNGRPALLALVHDLSERRVAERAAERFRMAMDASADAIFLIDPVRMRFIDFNETACSSLGYTRSELLELGPHDIKPLFNKFTLRERIGEVLAADTRNGLLQTEHRRKDGSRFPVEVRLRAFTSGKQRLLVAVARDISERHASETMLREANSRFQQLAENVSEVFWIRDLEENRFLYVSPAFETLFRKPVSIVYRHPRAFLGMVHPEDRERVSAAFEWQSQHRQGVELEYRIVVDDSETRWIWVRTFPIRDARGQVYRMAGIAEDVTQRRESEEQYRTLVQASMDGFLVTSLRGVVTDCNDAFCRCLGYHREEVVGQPLSLFEFNESADQIREHIRLVVEQGRDRFVTRHRHRNGHAIDMEISAYYRPDASGGSIYAFLRDISQRLLAEENLRISEERTRAVLRAAPVGIGVLSNGVLLNVNEALCAMTGYSCDELVGASLRLLYPDQEAYAAAVRNLDTQTSSQTIVTFETLWRRKDGGHLDVSVSSTPVDMRDPARGLTFTARDITAVKQEERNRLAHEARQREALVREVHHRIKNNLQGVIGLLRQQASSSPAIHDPIELAIAQINTISVVHGLQSRLPQNELRLRELLLEVNQAAVSLAMPPSLPTIEDGLSGDVWLDNSAAVSVALILNELIHNALKHQLPAHVSGVTLYLSGDAHAARIRVCNPATSLPTGFDLASGHALGTGLDLVRTLLPRHGATLAISCDGRQVCADFTLSPPVTIASLPAGEIHDAIP